MVDASMTRCSMPCQVFSRMTLSQNMLTSNEGNGTQEKTSKLK